MSKFLVLLMTILYLVAITVPVLAQEARPVEIRQIIEQRLQEDGFYLGNPDFSDGLRYIQFESDGQVAIWGFGDFRFNNDGQLILPLGEFTRQYIDLTDPGLRVTVGDHNQLIGQLMDSCLATGYPEKTMNEDVIFWLLQGKMKQP